MMITIVCFALAGIIGIFALYAKTRIQQENIRELQKKGILK